MKSRILRFVRNASISIVVLAVLIVGAGVAYTWYNGQDTTDVSQAIATPVEPLTRPEVRPVKPAPNARVGASVQQLTSPVAPGENASITVKTVATSKCTITVVYDKTASKDSGLSPKVADDYGMTTWTWTVDQSAPTGTWPVTVTCTYNKKSAVVKGDLKVATPKE